MGDRLRVYVSGPISDGGKRTVDAAIDAWCRVSAAEAQRLVTHGFAVLWPHGTVWMERLVGVTNHHDVWIDNDLPWVLCADAVLRIAGNSAGADRECEAATNAGIPVFREVDQILEWSKDQGPCQTALRLVYGPRQAAYDHPARDFGRIAKLWSGLFDREFTAEDVALAMIALKLSRLKGNPAHEDSVTDIAGYAQTYARVRECRESSGSQQCPSPTTSGPS